jgi:hypothetical protein
MVFAINNVNANVNNAANVLVNVAGVAVRGCANLIASIISDYAISASKPDGKSKRLMRERCDHGLHECHHTRQSMPMEIRSAFYSTVFSGIRQFQQWAWLNISLQLMTERVTTSLTSVNSKHATLSSSSISSN